MATMNVSIPDAMKEWVERQAAEGHYSNASDYVRALIRRDRERQGSPRLQGGFDGRTLFPRGRGRST